MNMELIYTRIGEHTIEVQCQSTMILNWMCNNFLITQPPKVTPHIRLQLTDGYGEAFVDYEVKISTETNKICYRRADYFIEAEPDYRSATIAVYNELALKHAWMNLYSSYLVYVGWGLLIHSSCVIDHDKAYLFAGYSGAGKSTAAKLSYPRELLSDEATIVKITSSHVTVFDSPFRSELSRTGSKEVSPLAGIYLLKQARTNHVASLSQSDAFLHLMDKVFYWTHSPDETIRILQMLRQMVRSISISELQFQKNNTFWELIS
ncbi:hypothetical protein [Paenibacillus sp. Soil750]|uniref:hypothetical protein n=1 Tax=Paenibacillus sp. Soil750 TaxID=1736398 RepID=UPI001F292B17|nr:hypothetical protein [Paenibacillus sp. Soil750]